MDDIDRKRRLDVLAAADGRALAQWITDLGELPAARPVRGPEIGMVMLRGRAGGGGALFNLGEATVTRASVKLEGGEIGHSVVLGRDLAKAATIAHLDALAQKPDWAARIDRSVVEPAMAAREAAQARRAEETEATRVDFFTMVRGED
jgi:alpha-D-ribose 1-methylphosphonate 5-triphosphate synthase subunit PhnG